VREELKRWGRWYYQLTKFDGVRLDAIKHIAPQFFNEWLSWMREMTGRPLFAVGEYWAPGDLALLGKIHCRYRQKNFSF
jgi:alpha-amylase